MSRGPGNLALKPSLWSLYCFQVATAINFEALRQIRLDNKYPTAGGGENSQRSLFLGNEMFHTCRSSKHKPEKHKKLGWLLLGKFVLKCAN